MMTSLNDIRTSFLDFFERHDHRVMPSAPLMPEHDPSLLFTNAGMVPFKDVFMGRRSPPAASAATAQKCIRAGGKHNDLDNVGYTARHHTFFEMLGNFSFGDYFKAQAIELAWRFLTEEMGLDRDRLWVTVYHQDDEADRLWRKISALPEARIIRIATADNFWSMGETGPCGPCSEIFYDHGEGVRGGPPGSANQDGDRFVEIWNLVFMQFERKADGSQIDLPKPAIDTGMGLERMAAVMQGVHDNYETDMFKHLIAAAEAVIGCTAEGERMASFRVIADHMRAIGFLIADGVMPANEGRGYVLRRILRRAMRHIHLLGRDEPALYHLTPALEAQMGAAYPELTRAAPLITETIKQEEERFQDMLQRGTHLLEQEIANLKAGEKLPGAIAFRLYDTYGFPLDLTQDALRRSGHDVDVAAFDAALAAQRDQARSAWKGSGDQRAEDIWLSLSDRLGASEFLGYRAHDSAARIIAIIKDGKEVEALAEGEGAILLLDQTPFYAEGGGQVGDQGAIAAGDNLFDVEDTQAHSRLHLHIGRQSSGRLKIGDRITAYVDHIRRDKIRANHSATHLLHQALRQVLGEHVAQRGSLVEDSHLRFDFSHAKPLAKTEIEQIESIVNRHIRQNHAVETKIMPQEEALASGALAMFGEKYDEHVRVLFMGRHDAAEAQPKAAFSIEFCGGTHVRRLGDIALFKITAQSAVGAGIRRLTALTGEAALDHFWAKERLIDDAAAHLNIAPDQLSERLTALIAENKQLKHSLKQSRMRSEADIDTSHIETIGEIKFMHRILEGVSAKDVAPLVDQAKQKLGSGIIAMLALHKGRAALTIGVTKDLTQHYDAVRLTKIAGAVLGSTGGGGRADFAQTGGPKSDQAEAAIETLRDALRHTVLN